jgi:digeranylgeranylglycerophospholipid reductase
VSDTVDVLVVGGGPAGLAVADCAAKAGSVLVAHRDASIGLPVRTSGASWKVGMDRLGIPESLYHPLSELLFAAPTRSVTVPFGQDHPVVIDVTETYRYLAGRAEASGARVQCGTCFERVIRRDKDCLTCAVSGLDGRREIRARFVVDASGHRRSVMQSLELGLRPERLGVGAEVEAVSEGDPGRAVLFVGDEFCPAGYGWMFPTRKGTVRVGVGVIRPDSLASPRPLLEQFIQSRAAKGMGLRLTGPVERHFGVIPSDGPCRRVVYDRVIAVGDSVGQALPLVGEGIRYCVEAGRCAGAALADALRDSGRYPEHLRRYETWWQRGYYRAFVRAQRVNEHISHYHDRQWDDKVSFLELLDGDAMAAFLRMDLTVPQALGLVLKSPGAFLRAGLWRTCRRYLRPPGHRGLRAG